MSDHVTSLRWLGNQLDADAADQGIGQGSEGARICWNAAIEIKSLRQQLAAALAACKAKDEKMQRVRLWMTDCSAETVPDSAYIPLVEAIAIRPDNYALDAWLGELK